MIDRSKAHKIERWQTEGVSPYAAPEQGMVVCGTWEDGSYKRSAPLVEADGRFIRTSSGSVYELGEPHPKFIEWLKAQDYNFDPEHPIKLVSYD